MRTSKRNKRVRKQTQRHRRRLKGGDISLVTPGAIVNWPDVDGCKNIRIEKITLQKGTLIDRFGADNGRYVAFLKKGANGKPSPFSYESRSIKTIAPNSYPINLIEYLLNTLTTNMYDHITKQRLRVALNIIRADTPTFGNVELRKMIFDLVYNDKNDTADYFIYRVIEPFDAIYPCQAAPFFEFPGGAYQVGLPSTVKYLVENKYLEKLKPVEVLNLIGSHFPPFSNPSEKTGPVELYESYLNEVVTISSYIPSKSPSAKQIKRTPTIIPNDPAHPNYRNPKAPPVQEPPQMTDL
jgi:hypothetical protein